jgi:hypothetical protein
MSAGAVTAMQTATDVSAEEKAVAAEQASLEVIHAEPESLSTVVDRVREAVSVLSEADIKAAVWRLHSQGLVDVTPEWRFKRR